MKPAPLLVAVTFLWGTTFVVTADVVTGDALTGAPPFAYMAARFGLAALFLVALRGPALWAARGDGQLWRDAWVWALLNGGGLIFQVLGQVYTTPPKSAFVTSLNTPLTPVMAFLIYRARPERRQLAALLLATGGVLLLTYPEGGAHWNRGDLITLGCAVLYGWTIVEIARRSGRHDALILSAAQILTTAVFLGAALGAVRLAIAVAGAPALWAPLALEARPWVMTPRLAAEVGYMALICTVVTVIGQTWAMARMSAVAAAIIFALEPVFTTIVSVIFRGASEWPSGRGAVGAVLVVIAAVASEKRRPS